MKQSKEKLSHKKIKNNNQKLILDTIRKGEISRAGLAKELGLSKPAVSSNVEELLEADVIVETGEIDSSSGRKATGLKINSDYSFFAGVTFKKSEIKIKFFDFGYNLRDFIVINVKAREKEPKKLLDEVKSKIEFEINKNDYKELTNIIVSFPGIIKNNVVNLSNLFPNFNGIDFSSILSNGFGKKVTVLNDMTIKTLGAHKEFTKEKYDNILFLSQERYGLGSGMFINGRFHEGINNSAGEIGLMYNMKSNFDALDIEHGVENYENILLGLINTLWEADVDWTQEVIKDDSYINLLAKYYSVIIYNISCVIAPEVVILGGLLPRLGEHFLSRVKTYFNKIIPVPINIVFSEDDEKIEEKGFVVFKQTI